MKEEIISFKVAKLAKEKGFDKVWCNNIYCVGFNDLQEDKEIIECDWRNNVNGQFHLALAPTQSLLQKWLREKYNIYVSAIPFNDVEAGQILWDNEIIDVNDDWNRFSDYTYYHSYEEALEAGLREALKLIKDE